MVGKGCQRTQGVVDKSAVVNSTYFFQVFVKSTVVSVIALRKKMKTYFYDGVYHLLGMQFLPIKHRCVVYKVTMLCLKCAEKCGYSDLNEITCIKCDRKAENIRNNEKDNYRSLPPLPPPAPPPPQRRR